MKNKIFALILFALSLNVFAGVPLGIEKPVEESWGGKVLVIISDDAVTTSNDTLISEWQDVGGYTQVEFMIFVDDTAAVHYAIDYSLGTFKTDAETDNDGVLTLAGVGLDSIVTTGAAVTGKIKGVIVRGIGTSAVTNLIPGANFVRIRLHRKATSETTITVKAAIKLTE